MLSFLSSLLPAAISGAFSLFGAKQNSSNVGQANLMNMQLAQANMAQQAQFQARQEALARETLAAQLSEAEATRAANLGINERNLAGAAYLNAQNIALQREFAQHGIQWRVQDAQAAGIHPMAALGGSGATYSPASFVGEQPLSGGNISGTSLSPPSSSSGSFSADTSMGNALSGIGQDISRALHATQNQDQRNDSYTAATQALSLEKGRVELDLLKSQLARLRQTPNPGMPVGQRFGLDGQGQTAVKHKEGEITGRDPRQPNTEGFAIPDVGYAQTRTGHAPVPSKDVKERIEDNWIQEVMWAFRNNALPSLGMNLSPPNAPGKWSFNPVKQEYQRRDFSKMGRIERAIQAFR